MQGSLLLAIATTCGLASAEPAPRADAPAVEAKGAAPIFVPFDFYPRHRKPLGLTEEQVRSMQQISDALRKDAQRLEDERAKRTQALQSAVAQNPVDVDRAMAAFESVLQAENELKSLQFRSGLSMRNVLTPEQLGKVPALAAKDSADRIGGARASLLRRVQELRAEVHQRTGGKPPQEIVQRIQQIEQSAAEGRFGEAKNLLESVLRRLRGEPEPGSPSDISKTPAAPPR